MRRAVRTTALTGLTALVALALPLHSASACSRPHPGLGLSADRVPQGATVRVWGDFTSYAGPCQNPAPPTTAPPSEEPAGTVAPSEQPGTIGPSQEPSGSAQPLPTGTPLPLPMVPVAHAEALTPPSLPVLVTIGTPKEPWTNDLAPGAVRLGEAPFTRDRLPNGDVRWRFATTVTIPASLAPGRYLVHAASPTDFDFGVAEITVLAALPDTGNDIAPVARLAALLLAGGVGALALEQARARRTRA